MLANKLRSGRASNAVSITDKNVNGMGFGTQTVAYRLSNTGLVQKVHNSVPTTLETWLVSGAASSYEVRVTDNTGNLTSGTTGSWLSLATTREWEISESGSGVTTSTNLTVEIRMAASPFTVLDTAYVDITVTVF